MIDPTKEARLHELFEKKHAMGQGLTEAESEELAELCRYIGVEIVYSYTNGLQIKVHYCGDDGTKAANILKGDDDDE